MSWRIDRRVEGLIMGLLLPLIVSGCAAESIKPASSFL
jgi:hypothetical protein